MKMFISIFATGVVLLAAPSVFARSAQDEILKSYQQQAGAPFSAARGKTLFTARHEGGKAETPSCTTCHTGSPLKTGTTRVGKPIAPMALSRSPERYSDLKKVKKWFRRNCRSVLGRECTVQEKGDFLTFMFNQ
jgi:hypothetical protein